MIFDIIEMGDMVYAWGDPGYLTTYILPVVWLWGASLLLGLAQQPGVIPGLQDPLRHTVFF